MSLVETDTIPDLMLTEGGPAHALLVRLKVILPEPRTGLARTALILAAITWVPLCLLSLLEGLAFRRVTIPFFEDIAVHVRFLLAVPILIVAEVPIGRRIREVARHFLTAGLVSDADAPRYAEIVTSARRLRDSHVVEYLLVILAYWAAYKAMTSVTHSGSTWFRPGSKLTPVGYWYVFVSLPIWFFLVWRWAFRMVVWSRFLWQVSKMPLVLTPSHPDRAGGLGFLGKALIPFGIVAFALSAATSGAVASRILFSGARLQDFQGVFITLVIFILVFFTGPLLVFAPTLNILRQTGLLRYGTLASRYTLLFDRKWVETAEATDQRILGTEDIQSLASLGGSYDMISRMRVVPVELQDFIALAFPMLIPVLPLLLTVIPLSVILKSLLHLMGV
jgi:hypothetical protein